MRGDLVIDKSKGARRAPGDGAPDAGATRRSAASSGEDHIVANLRHLFRGVEEEELPERFRALLEELGKKEKS